MLEQAAYFNVPGADLYTVLHTVEDPVARVLLVGSFASERHFSYHPWVRWARYLAQRRIEVLRYDYRGVGESTGIFENLTFSHWEEDTELLARWLGGRSPQVPTLLHGLEVGAVLAANCFDRGSGDALLLWSPPESANQALRSSLLRWARLEQMFESSEYRKSVSAYIEQLDAGEPIEVQGYRWSSSIWRDSFKVTLPPALADEALARQEYGRPTKIVKLTKDAAPLVKPFVGYDQVRDLKWLYDENFNWFTEALGLTSSGT